MFKFLKKYLRKVFHVKDAPDSQSFLKNVYCSIDPSSFDKGMLVRFDSPLENKKYVEIGKDCIVSGCFIFESESGHVSIGNHSYIGDSIFISRKSIEIGDNVTIAWGCTIYDHNSHSLSYKDRRKDIDDELSDIRCGRCFTESKDWSVVKTESIKICDDSWIGMNCTILKGVTIGEGAVVGAGSVVTKDVMPWTVVAGNPAKVIKKLKHQL